MAKIVPPLTRATLATTAAIFAITVWPTWYRYDHITLGQTTLPVRTNRFTGQSEVLYTTGWQKATSTTQETRDTERALPAEELRKVTGKGGWCALPDAFCIDLYNGSKWKLTELSINIEDSNDHKSNNPFAGLSGPKFTEALSPAVQPYSSDHVIIQIYGWETRPVSWKIVEAKGVPAIE